MKRAKHYQKKALAAVLSGSSSRAKKIIDRGLQVYPDHPRLLRTARKIAQLAGDHDVVLNLSVRLVLSSPDRFDLHAGMDLLRELMAQARWDDAKAVVDVGMRHHHSAARLIRLARDVNRLSGNISDSLGWAISLDELGCSGAEDERKFVEMLLLSGDSGGAHKRIRDAIEKYPDDKWLLNLASDVCRVMADRTGSLSYAKKLMHSHPGSWAGYQRAATDLVAIDRCEEACRIIEQGKLSLADSDLASRLAEGLRLQHCRRFMGSPRTRGLMQAWQETQVWCDPEGVHVPLPLGGKDGINLPFISKKYVPRWVQTDPVQPIQYWSQGRPPQEVQDLTDQWNDLLESISLPKILLYSRESAREWIAAYAPSYLVAFDTAFHYAVESDVFRIAYASRNEFLYLDSDLWPRPWTAVTLRAVLRSGSSVLYSRSLRPMLNSCFFVARKNCPYFRFLCRSCEHVNFNRLPQTMNTVMNTFGPDKYSYCLRYFFATGGRGIGVAKLLPGVLELSASAFKLVLVNEEMIAAGGPPGGLSYKQTDLQWHVFLKNRAA